MPMVMEKKDWMQTVANVETAAGVWYENVAGDAGSVSVSLPEGGRYQVILVKIDSLSKAARMTHQLASDKIDPAVPLLKIGAMKEEVRLPEDFDRQFEGLDDRVASMFSGAVL